MRRKALVVGISEYDHLRALPACLKDAASMAQVLANNKDEGDGPGTLNYDVTVWPGRTTEGARITRGELRGAMEKLFASDDEVLFHFSGHGYLAASGGFICTTDASRNDYGISMGEIGAMAAASPARNILVILDCCHAGAAGDAPGQRNTNGFQFATLREEDVWRVICECGSAEPVDIAAALIDAANAAGGPDNITVALVSL